MENKYINVNRLLIALSFLICSVSFGLFLHQLYPQPRGIFHVIISSLLLTTIVILRENVKCSTNRFKCLVGEHLEMFSITNKLISLSEYTFQCFDFICRQWFIVTIINSLICFLVNILILKFNIIQMSPTGIYILIVMDIFVCVAVLLCLIIIKLLGVVYCFKQQFLLETNIKYPKHEVYKEACDSFIKDLSMYIVQVILNICILVLIFCN